ncbi:PAS domain-containing protein [Kineobactrum salinum]|uniref:PAS domain S-box protein n=1 Tax=Kineobactrum salinum TaxID=2708301 RepID=A0A6C0U0Y3_9GAMM|nr:PAS domain-containing protein [Kineobactrum salinum]QIB64637.1 PAS domain S-box protein [Kineobactrum salinum]
MTTSTAEQSIYTQLRKEAETRLGAGTAAAYGNWSLDVEALQLLHKLSSDPRTAPDALKLLHELQVHQVELDLQNEEIHINEQGLVEELARYRELYESAPCGYFLVDFQGEIIEGNRAGAELFGAGQNDLRGSRFDHFLAADSRPALRSLLERLRDTGTAGSCDVTVDDTDLRPMRVLANASADQCCALLVCCEST